MRKLIIILLTGFWAGCTPKNTKTATEQTAPPPDSTVVRIPTPVDTAVVVPDPATDTATVAADARQPTVIASFNGTVRGFGTQSFTFRLNDDQAVALKLDSSRRAMFKLYRKTGELDETVTKEEQREWEGDLVAGEYEIKVFLPLKPTNRKRTESFRMQVLAQ